MNISTKQFFIFMALSGVIYTTTAPMNIPMQEIQTRRRLAKKSNFVMQDITEIRRLRKKHFGSIQKPAQISTRKKPERGESAWSYGFTHESPKNDVGKVTVLPDGTIRSRRSTDRYIA